MRNAFAALAIFASTFVWAGNAPVDAAATRAWCGDGVCQPADGESLTWCSDCFCGDDECEFMEGETEDSCYADCAPPPPGYFPPGNGEIRYPNNGIDWSQNEPEGVIVNDCFGNCGKGCSDSINPCGGPDQYWELTLRSSPQYGIYWSVCQSGDMHDRYYDGYWADSTWSYHGYEANGCIVHDSYCPEWTFFACVVFAGCGSGHAKEWSYDGMAFSVDWSNYTTLNVAYDHPECDCTAPSIYCPGT